MMMVAEIVVLLEPAVLVLAQMPVVAVPVVVALPVVSIAPLEVLVGEPPLRSFPLTACYDSRLAVVAGYTGPEVAAAVAPEKDSIEVDPVTS